MLLVQVWETLEKMEEFQVSDKYTPFWSVLSAVSEPKIHQVRPLTLRLFDSFIETLSVVTVHFPWPMSEEQKKSISHVKAIFAGGFGLRAQHLALMIAISTKLWAVEPEETWPEGSGNDVVASMEKC